MHRLLCKARTVYTGRVTVELVMVNIVRPFFVAYGALLYYQGLKTGILLLYYCSRIGISRCLERLGEETFAWTAQLHTREATAILGAVIGKPNLAYVELSYEDFRKGLLGVGFSASAADVYVEMYTAFNEGRIQSTVSRNALNTTPTTLEEFAYEVFAPAYQAS